MSKLNINNKLPQIIIPSNKLQLFIDLYNTDLIYEEISEVFNEGYIKLDLDGILKCKIPSIFEIQSEREFTMYQNIYNEIMKLYSRLFVYFRFSDNAVQFIIYDTENNIIYKDAIDLIVRKLKIYTIVRDETDKSLLDKLYGQLNIKSLEINFKDIMTELSSMQGLNTKSNMDKVFGMYIGDLFKRLTFGVLISSFWYLTTLKPKAKDNLLYASVSKKHQNKDKLYNSNTVRTITTPIYNFKYMSNTTREKLSARHNSWQISYSFPVRGHYRHYKNGKVVFIKSYEKGKGKQSKTTKLKLNPKSLI